MQYSGLRFATVLTVVVALTACSDAAPTAAVVDSASLARGSSQGGVDSRNTSRQRVEIALTAPAGSVLPRANGKAKFSSKPGERELQIEVEDMPVGTAVVFMLGSTQLGTATANAFGEARLNLNSTQGQNVPTSVAGQSVTVTTAAGGLIVTGSF